MQGKSEDQRELLDVESVAGHLLKPGGVFAFLAGHRGELFPDEMFADLFPRGRGRPSVPGNVMASVITLQGLHGLSDSETVEAVTFDLRCKAACGLCHGGRVSCDDVDLLAASTRGLGSAEPDLDAVKAVVAQTGVLAGRTRRAVDSTILDDAVATQDTVTQLIGAIRRVGREVPGAAAVIAEHCRAHDYLHAGKPKIAWDDEAARADLVDALVGDAHQLLGHLPEQEIGPKGADALALLALVAGQDVEPVEGSDGTDGRWRIAQRVAPDRVISTVDPEARHAHKTVHRRQDGFKGRLAVEPDTGLITACTLTKASGPDCSDAAIGPTLLADEPAPVQVLADSAYGSGQARAELAEAGHDAVIKPLPVRAPVAGGFTIDDFAIDFTAQTVTCPAGHTKTITRSRSRSFGLGTLCRDCPLRSRCTTAKEGRSLTLHEHEALLRAARRQAETPQFQAVYRQHRPMVERGIAWLTRGNRKSPLPRHREERPLAASPRSRPEPAPTHHPRTRPRRHRVGDQLNLAPHPCRPAPTDDRLVIDAPGKFGVQPRFVTYLQTAMRHPARHLTPKAIHRTALVQEGPRPNAQ